MKRKFVVRCYCATAWSLFSQADHYEDYNFASTETLEEFAKRICKEGFSADDKTWIAPGAIVSIKAL